MNYQQVITIMVEVFKTTVREPDQAQRIVAILERAFPGVKINIDLDQCENILRVEGPDISSDLITATVAQAGFSCEVLEDKICIGSKELPK